MILVKFASPTLNFKSITFSIEYILLIFFIFLVQMQKDLEISAVIGFSGNIFSYAGNIYDGLLLHPDN
jgi:hypothetical protein